MNTQSPFPLERFLSKTQTTEAHVQLAKALIACPGDDRVVAAYLAPIIKAAWIKRLQAKPSKFVCLRALRVKCPGIRTIHLPGADHPEVFRTPWGYVYTIQPYSIDGDDLAQMTDWAALHDLELSVSASGSWHFPGSTILVEVWRKADYKQFIRSSTSVASSPFGGNP